jgi:hypothetical protein
MTVILIKVKIMHCIVICATGMDQYLSKISSEISIFNFDTYHVDTLYLSKQGYLDLWLY